MDNTNISCWECPLCGRKTSIGPDLKDQKYFFCEKELSNPIFIREEFNKWTGKTEKVYRYTCNGKMIPKYN